MRSVLEFPDIEAGDGKRQTLGFDFGRFLPAGVTLVTNPTVEIHVIEGDDPSPSDRLIGAAVIGTIPLAERGSGKSNTAILQQVGNFPGTVEYVIAAACERSDGDTANMWTHIKAVLPA